MLVHKSCEVEARLVAAGTVILEDDFGMLQGRAVNEGFAVRKDALHLHRDEQLLIALGGGKGIGQRNGADVMAERLTRRDIGHCSL